VPFGPSSLRTRLVVVFTAGAALAVLGAGAFLFVAIDRALLAEVNTALQVRSDDLEAIARSTDGEIPDRDPFAQILSADGAILDASPDQVAGVPALAPEQLAPDRLGAAGAFFDVEVPALGGRSRVWARPVDIDGKRFVLVVGDALDQYARTRQTLLVVLLVGGPVFVAVSAAAGWLLAGAALRPVRQMAQEADAISITDLDRRLEVPAGNDELAELGRTSTRCWAGSRTPSTERRFLDDASHELRTPLTILRGELELARSTRRPRRGGAALRRRPRRSRTVVAPVCRPPGAGAQPLRCDLGGRGHLRPGGIGPSGGRAGRRRRPTDRHGVGPGRGDRRGAGTGGAGAAQPHHQRAALRRPRGPGRAGPRVYGGGHRGVGHRRRRRPGLPGLDAAGDLRALRPTRHRSIARRRRHRSRLAISAETVRALHGTIHAGNGGPWVVPVTFTLPLADR
jgi:hypothetical protein